MDHLLGKVFVEYLSPLKRDRIKTKMLKKTRERSARMRPRRRRLRGASAHASRLRRHAGVRRASRCARCTPPASRSPLVLTQPDRPAGRGMKLQPSPVKAFALEHGMARGAAARPAARRQVRRRRARRAQALLERRAPDVHRRRRLRAASCRRGCWSCRRHGCLNIHASLLPRWRGAAPIQRAIEAGDDAHRHHDHADGRRPRHRRRCCSPRRSTIGADDTTGDAARPAGRARRRADRRRRCGALARGAPRRARRSRATASPTRTRSTRPKRRSTGAQPAAAIERRAARLRSVSGRHAAMLDGETIKLLARRGRAGRRRAPGEVLAVDGGALTRRLRRRRAGADRAAARRRPAPAGGGVPARPDAAGRRRLRPAPIRRRPIELRGRRRIYRGDASRRVEDQTHDVQSAENRRPDGGHHRAVHGDRLAASAGSRA